MSTGWFFKALNQWSNLYSDSEILPWTRIEDLEKVKPKRLKQSPTSVWSYYARKYFSNSSPRSSTERPSPSTMEIPSLLTIKRITWGKCIKIGENVTNNTQVYRKDAFEIATSVINIHSIFQKPYLETIWGI